MKNYRYRTDLTRYGEKIAEELFNQIDQWGVKVERDGLIGYHSKKLARWQVEYLKGLASGLTIAQYDVE